MHDRERIQQTMQVVQHARDLPLEEWLMLYGKLDNGTPYAEMSISYATHRALGMRYDQLHDRYTALHQTLTALVDALFRLPDASVWTQPQQAHLRLTLREALQALDAADDQDSGGAYG